MSDLARDPNDTDSVRRLWTARSRHGLGFHGEDRADGMVPDRIETLHPAVKRDPTLPLGLVVIYKHAATGIEFVYVPGGAFVYGSRDDDSQADADEKPQVVADLPGFYMSRFPVTEDTRPRVNVSWPEARAWAVEHGFALPSEMQWEKAARGTDGRKFPWGDSDSTERLTERSPVGLRPQHASPYGVEDASGHVWAWTDDVYTARRQDTSGIVAMEREHEELLREMRGPSELSRNQRGDARGLLHPLRDGTAAQEQGQADVISERGQAPSSEGSRQICERCGLPSRLRGTEGSPRLQDTERRSLPTVLGVREGSRALYRCECVAEEQVGGTLRREEGRQRRTAHSPGELREVRGHAIEDAQRAGGDSGASSQGLRDGSLSRHPVALPPVPLGAGSPVVEDVYGADRRSLQRPGSSRVYRGGCWNNPAPYCRASYRFRFAPGYRYDFLGFRVVG